MSEHQIKLTGWPAIVGVVVLAGVVGVRFATLGDKSGDGELMRQLELQLTTEHFPGDVAALQAAVESGDAAEVAAVAGSVTGDRFTIEEVRASSPPFSFKSSEDVVVKITYSRNDPGRGPVRETRYYRFRHGAIGNAWQFEYETNVVAYYLNVM